MDSIRRILNYTPKTKIYYGWIVLLTASLGTFACTGVSQQTIVAIQTIMLTETGWDRTQFALGISTGTWIVGFLTPIFGRLADKYGPRFIMPFAMIVLGICFYIIGGANSIWTFYFGYIIARGLGTPILVSSMPRNVAVNFFFRKRNLAMGFVFMARPFYAAGNIQLISNWISSWRTGYRILGLYAFVVAIPMLMILRKSPESIGLLPDGRLPSNESRTSISNNLSSNEVSWKVSEAMKTNTFWYICITQFLAITVLGTIGFQTVPYLNDTGLSLSIAVLAWTLASLMDSVFNPICGFLADRYTPRKVYFVVLPLTLIATSLFLLVDGGIMGFIVVLLWAAASGGLEVLGSMLTANYYGRNSFGAISGVVGSFQIG
ncbi:MAG: hypothetical protein CL782_06580, partial [Chloroflexi bacterium]|nr:hypothetical protein [Chloroflexota bacterium]